MWLGLIAATAVAVAPLLIGTKVADTLATGIVPIAGHLELLVVVMATTSIVVAVSNRFGFATSIGLALVGALFGVGMGADLEIDRGAVLRILILGAASPVVAVLLGRLISIVVTAAPVVRKKRRSANDLRWVTYTLLCMAYGLNDGQKALAVLTLALGIELGDLTSVAPVAVLAAFLFLGGMLIGGRPVASRTGRGLARAFPIELATADFVSSVVVVTGSSLGTPLSMTQAISGAVVGVTSRTGWRYVRWPIMGRLALAWVLTFPMTALAAGLAASLVV
jgi:PiT family inorganic phosphate transporter